MREVAIANHGADFQAAVGLLARSIERQYVDVDERGGRSTFSFIRSISVVPPATNFAPLGGLTLVVASFTVAGFVYWKVSIVILAD